MSTAVNNHFQDYDPRQRLTGAIVLILIAVILLPILLSKQPEPGDAGKDPVVMEVTKEGEKVFISRISAITPPDEKRPQTASPETPVKSSPTTGSASKAVESKSAPPVATASTQQETASVEPVKKAKVVAKPEPASVTTKKSKPAPVQSTGDWLLQIGVFSLDENARKKVAELKKKGFDAHSGRVRTSKGVVTKVWLGPYNDRETAKRMQDRLQHKTRERGYVVQGKTQ